MSEQLAVAVAHRDAAEAAAVIEDGRATSGRALLVPRRMRMVDCINYSRAIALAKNTSLEVYRGALATGEPRDGYTGSSEWQ